MVALILLLCIVGFVAMGLLVVGCAGTFDMSDTVQAILAKVLLVCVGAIAFVIYNSI